ncbi:sensor histidine kinase [Planobispora longispora]|uniref:histidine kinase n=1 Tax=Planobispora longispora TaxID=28887 RepID=A0A8J3RLA4_9ACTN|nr:HAMP domain-containing sensor histidine kinase [Planobispora longispora]GIH75699.1 two-component sensor histidine kinase [Planobispora longispora]
MTGKGETASAGSGRPARRLRGLSLRGRLLSITTALLVAGLVVSSTVAIAALRSHLVSRVDGQVKPLATLLARVAPEAVPPASQESGRAALRMLPGMDVLDQVHIVYLAPDGTPQYQTSLAARGREQGPRLPPLDAGAVARLGGRPFDVPGPGSGTPNWRVVAVPLAARQSPPGHALPAESGSVVVAASLEGVRSTLTRLALVCLVTSLVLLALLAAIGWFAIGRGLRPLRGIEETAAAIAEGDLSRRVPDLTAPGTEVSRLSAAINGMLGQLERAFAGREASEARMRRFVADASHELRTPLFGIKGFSELHRMGGLPDVDRAMRRIESEAGRLTRLIEDLLLLARLDEGESAPPMELTPMDLRTLAVDAHHDLQALDSARRIALTGPDGGPPGKAPVHGDEARLRQVTANLVGNAVAHTPPGTPVRVGVGMVGDEAVLVIEDTGPGMTAEQAARVFERFYRVEDSRSRTAGGGAGLGLAIVGSIVTAHGGRMELRTAPDQGAAFRMVLPAAPDPAP